MTESYDITETLKDLDAGVFTQQVTAAMQEVALGVVENDKKGKLTLTFEVKRIGESHQVQINHSVSYISPTRRGDKRETVKSSTAMHVGRGGRLSIMPEQQTDMFKTPEKSAV